MPTKRSARSAELNITEFISGCRTEFDVHRACAMVGERYGYNYFSIIRMPDKGETRLAELAVASNWPVTLIRQYDEMSLLEHSPVMRALSQSALPYVWDIEQIGRKRSDGKDEAVIGLFKRHNMTRGVYFPTYSPLGVCGAVSFAGDRGNDSQAALMNLSFHSNMIFARTCELGEFNKPSLPTLSRREKECIVWTSHGKTSYEIGMILGLSEHTINNYLANVCKKLGAVNRAHLVGIVLRNKILA